MKKIRLEIGNIYTVRALHIYLEYMLNLPKHYGRNLDALHDALCEESESVGIVLEGNAASDEMTLYLPKIERVLRVCAQENEHICFERS